jgi:AraC-like DNA-binding protein
VFVRERHPPLIVDAFASYPNFFVLSFGPRMLPTLSHRRLSDADLRRSEQFEAFRQHMGPFYTIERSVEERLVEHVSVDGYLVGDLWFANARFPAARYIRSPNRVRRDNVDILVITAFVSGKSRGVVNGDSVEREQHYLQILDFSREQFFEMSAIDCCTMLLRRQEIADRLGDLRQLGNFELEGRNARILHDHIQLLGTRSPELQQSSVAEMERATYDLVAACLRPSRALIEQARPALEAAMLSRARQYIAQRLAEATLSPERICRDIGISRRSLYRLFEPLGGVSRYIQDCRVERIYELLQTEPDANSIADIAARHGFENKEVFWRAFKRRFGVTPGDVRQRGTKTGLTARAAAAVKASSVRPWIAHLCR